MRAITFCALMFITLMSFNAHAQETLLYSSHEASMDYLLMGKVTKAGSIGEGWVKVINTNNLTAKNNLANFRKNKIQMRENSNKSTKGYDKYLYSMHLYQVDCKTKKFRVIEESDYDENGTLLSNEKTPATEWNDDVAAGSIFDNIVVAICSK